MMSILTKPLHLDNGLPVFLQPSHDLALVDFELVFRQGSLLDPIGQEGLSHLMGRMLRRGTRGMKSDQVDLAIDSLGAAFGMSVNPSSFRIHGSVISRNLEPFLTLIGRLLLRPAFRAKDLDWLKRQSKAELIAVRDHDRALAARAFRRHLFEGHPYGRPISGTLASIADLGRKDIVELHQQQFQAQNMMIGVAGDVLPDTLMPLLEKIFGSIPEGAPEAAAIRAPRLRAGRRIVVVDKPERKQTQVYVGTLGSRLGEKDYHSLLVSNTVFGGTFTSRLVKEVRSERGWSYGVGSKLGADRQREAWTMWSHPGAEQLVDCLALELELLDSWVGEGPSGEEVARAKRYLQKGFPFSIDTAEKRLGLSLDQDLYRLPAWWFDEHVSRVGAVDEQGASEATRKRIDPSRLSISVLATVTDSLLASLADLPGVTSVQTRAYDAEGSQLNRV